MRRLLLAALAGASILGLAGCGTAGAGAKPTASTVPSAVQQPGTGSFLSLWPACACGRRTVLDRFSLKDGRKLQTLARIRVAWPEYLATPSVDRAGRVWMTFSSGPKCTNDTATCGPVPNSCAQGRTERLDPRTGRTSTVLSFPDSEYVHDAIPRPDAGHVVLVEGGCITSYFNEHLVVRDMRSGQQWSIGADAAPCHELGTPSWSANGTRLVFAYGPSRLRKGTPDTPNTCAAPKFNRLVIVSSRRPSKTTRWHLIRAQRKCSYESATFDRLGVAAVEACVHGRQGSWAVNTGPAFLVQLNQRNRIIHRLQLQPGWEDGSISTERDGRVLVSQSQPANAGYPERDWVWQLNGRRLTAVAHYRAHDAAQVIAVPTAAR